jgi:hypothetical protein
VDTLGLTTPATGQPSFTLIGASGATPGYDLNPGSGILFPWLSTQASCYEEYQFNRVQFRLIPKQPVTAVGWVTMAFDYDYDDAISATKRDILTNQSVVEGPCYEELTIKVDIASLNRVLTTRYIVNSDFYTTQQEARMSMAGYLEIGTDSLGPSTSYGWDLWIDYDVTMRVPRPPMELSSAMTVTVSNRPPVVQTGSPNRVIYTVPIGLAVMEALRRPLSSAPSGSDLSKLNPSGTPSATGNGFFYDIPGISFLESLGEFAHLALGQFGAYFDQYSGITPTVEYYDTLGAWLGATDLRQSELFSGAVGQSTSTADLAKQASHFVQGNWGIQNLLSATNRSKVKFITYCWHVFSNTMYSALPLLTFISTGQNIGVKSHRF